MVIYQRVNPNFQGMLCFFSGCHDGAAKPWRPIRAPPALEGSRSFRLSDPAVECVVSPKIGGSTSIFGQYGEDKV